jgi:hypothetical protein
MKISGPYSGDLKSVTGTPMAHKRPSSNQGEPQFGVGLVFRNMRDGKLVVDSFIKDSSAYQSGVVRDGGSAALSRKCHFGACDRISADILTAVNDISIDSVQRENITKLLMGPLESVVELRFMRPVDR